MKHEVRMTLRVLAIVTAVVAWLVFSAALRSVDYHDGEYHTIDRATPAARGGALAAAAIVVWVLSRVSETTIPRLRRWTIHSILVAGAIALLLDVFTLFFGFTYVRSRDEGPPWRFAVFGLDEGRIGIWHDVDSDNQRAKKMATVSGAHIAFNPHSRIVGRYETLRAVEWEQTGQEGLEIRSVQFAGFGWQYVTHWSRWAIDLRVPLYALWLPAVIILLWRWRTRRRDRLAVGFPVQPTSPRSNL